MATVPSATPRFGGIEFFDPDSESILAYLERMDLFLEANAVAEEKKVAVVLSMVGSKAYQLLRNLCSPDKPQSKSYSDLKGILTNHYDPKPLVIA